MPASGERSLKVTQKVTLCTVDEMFFPLRRLGSDECVKNKSSFERILPPGYEDDKVGKCILLLLFSFVFISFSIESVFIFENAPLTNKGYR